GVGDVAGGGGAGSGGRSARRAATGGEGGGQRDAEDAGLTRHAQDHGAARARSDQVEARGQPRRAVGGGAGGGLAGRAARPGGPLGGSRRDRGRIRRRGGQVSAGPVAGPRGPPDCVRDGPDPSGPNRPARTGSGEDMTLSLAWPVFRGVVLSAPAGSWEAEDPRRESGASTTVQYEMPERLRRQVAPAPSTPWRAPDLHQYTSVLKSAEPPAIDP